jgi:hypothetical protein
LGTLGFSINAGGAITGYYVGGKFPFTNHGFVRDPQGSFSSFDPPGSTSTIAQSINDGGAITGYYSDGSNVKHGFVRLADGTLISFDPPGSTATTALSINANGTIAGYYQVANIVHGFVRQPDGTIVTFDPPQSTGIMVIGINSAGAITGHYTVNGRTIWLCARRRRKDYVVRGWFFHIPDQHQRCRIDYGLVRRRFRNQRAQLCARPRGDRLSRSIRRRRRQLGFFAAGPHYGPASTATE